MLVEMLSGLLHHELFDVSLKRFLPEVQHWTPSFLRSNKLRWMDEEFQTSAESF